MLNNREWAAVIWLVLLSVGAVSYAPIRSSLRPILRTLSSLTILVPLAMLIANVAGIIWLGQRVGIWRTSLVPETVVWFAGSAVVLFVKSGSAASQKWFLVRAVARTLQLTVLVELFMNLFVFSLPAELILQPVVTLMVTLSAFAGSRPDYRQAKNFLDVITALIGFGLGAFVVVQLIEAWRDLDAETHLLELFLPLWMTLGVIPYMYVFSVWAAYEKAFLRIDLAIDERRLRRRVKLALVTTLGGRRRAAATFGPPWPQRAAYAGSFWKARRLIGDYRLLECD